jgi:cell division protein FtsB
VAAILAAGAGAASLFVPQFRRFRNFQAEQAQLESAIRAEEERYPELMKRIDQLQHDPAVVERVARETLGLARPGETIYRFRNPPEEMDVLGEPAATP